MRQRRVANTRVRILTVLNQEQKPSESLRSFEPLISVQFRSFFTLEITGEPDCSSVQPIQLD